MRIDLHSHTTCSDGKLTPAELIERAVNKQIDVLAITDHDSVVGLQQAQQHIEQHELPITLVNGVEISCRWHGYEIHVLGLNLDDSNETLLQGLANQSDARVQRAVKIAEKLEKLGLENAQTKVQALAKGKQVCRSHFAQLLHDEGWVEDFDSAFKKYLGKGAKAFAAPKWVDIQKAISWIKEAGGDAVLAHPGSYDMKTKWLRRLIIEFKEAGGAGMEVGMARIGIDKRKLMAELCREYELHASYGSDFHGPSPWVELGKNFFIPEDCVPIWDHWNFKG